MLNIYLNRIVFTVVGGLSVLRYSDVIMGAIASQTTSLTNVYSTVYSGTDKKKTAKLRVTGLCEGKSPVTDEFHVQRASNAENVSIWWRHHGSNLSWPSYILKPHIPGLRDLRTCPIASATKGHWPQQPTAPVGECGGMIHIDWCICNIPAID